MKYILIAALMTANMSLFGIKPGKFGVIRSGESAIQSLQEKAGSSSDVHPTAERQRKHEFIQKVAKCETTPEWWAAQSSVPQEWVNEALIALALQGPRNDAEKRMECFEHLLAKKANLHYKNDAALFYFACRFCPQEIKKLEEEYAFRFSTYKSIMEYYQTVVSLPCTSLPEATEECLDYINMVMTSLVMPMVPETYSNVLDQLIFPEISDISLDLNVIRENVLRKIPQGRTVMLGEIRDLFLAEAFPELADYFNPSVTKEELLLDFGQDS